MMPSVEARAQGRAAIFSDRSTEQVAHPSTSEPDSAGQEADRYVAAASSGGPAQRPTLLDVPQAVAFLQRADEGLGEVALATMDMRAIAIEAANLGGDVGGDREEEFQRLRGVVDTVARSTEYEGGQMFDGNMSRMLEAISVGNNIIQVRVQMPEVSLERLQLSGRSITSKPSALQSIDKLDDVIHLNSNYRMQINHAKDCLLRGSEVMEKAKAEGSFFRSA